MLSSAAIRFLWIVDDRDGAADVSDAFGRIPTVIDLSSDGSDIPPSIYSSKKNERPRKMTYTSPQPNLPSCNMLSPYQYWYSFRRVN